MKAFWILIFLAFTAATCFRMQRREWEAGAIDFAAAVLAVSGLLRERR